MLRYVDSTGFESSFQKTSFAQMSKWLEEQPAMLVCTSETALDCQLLGRRADSYPVLDRQVKHHRQATVDR